MLEPRIGTTVFGRYLLEKELAKGAMGSVWIARDRRLERKVAIKTLKTTWVDSKDAMARFEREAMAVAKLNSPYIVQIFDYGVDNKCPFIVMELMKGEDLDSRLKKHKRIGVWDLIPIVVQTAKALTVAHQAGIVHRDLKPGNLFLVRSEEEEIVKVLDFGVAKATQNTDQDKADHEQEATKAGTLLGTPVFMSPEQARGVKDIDLRADLWSLGVIIFRALTGKLPFVGTSVTDTIVKICTAPVPRATAVAPDLPAEVDTFFNRALARNPMGRFKTARELASAFAQIAPRQSFPSMTLPGLPQDVQQEILESGLASSGGYSSQPGITPSAMRNDAAGDGVAGSDRAHSPGVVADVGAGQLIGGAGGPAPFAPAPSARNPRVGPTFRSEATTLRPQAKPVFDPDADDDDDDDQVTSMYQAEPGKDGKFRLPGVGGGPLGTGIDDEETHDRSSALPGLVDDETTSDHVASQLHAELTDSQVRREVTPPPLPGAAIVDVEGSMDPISARRPATDEEHAAEPASGGLFDAGGAQLRESHGTLGAQAQSIDTPTEATIPKKGGRLGVILGAVAAVVAIGLGAAVLLSSGDDSAASETAPEESDATHIVDTSAPLPTVATTGEPTEPDATTTAPTETAEPDDTAEPSQSAVPTAEPTTEPVATAAKPPVGVAPDRPPAPPKPPPRPPKPPAPDTSPEDTYDSRY